MVYRQWNGECGAKYELHEDCTLHVTMQNNVSDRVIVTAQDILRVRDDVVRLEVDSGVTEIADSAFRDAWFLETVSLDVDVIGNTAFYRCEQLHTIDIRRPCFIGQSAFYGCGLTGTIVCHAVNKEYNDWYAMCQNIERIVFSEHLIKLNVTKETFSLLAYHALKEISIGQKTKINVLGRPKYLKVIKRK